MSTHNKRYPRIRPGGLMNCCILTINEDAPHSPAEGKKIKCRYCSSGTMIFKNGAWEWVKEE